MSGIEKYSETSAQTQVESSALTLLSDTWTKNTGDMQLVSAQKPGGQDVPPAPTEQQIRTMHERAAQGQLTDTAGIMGARALQENGLRGLTDLRNDINRQLETANSEYRARVARVDGPNGQINLYMILQRNGENLNDMIRDVHQNGANSQYRGRFIHFELTPQRQADV